jgi:predicted nucleotidyltransferase component of viral defense system
VIQEKFVDLFAHTSKIRDKTVAERDVILTYALQLMSISGLLRLLAFRGGTCIRKILLGTSGRFSMDLDFTALKRKQADDFVVDMMEVLNCEFHGITFRLEEKWRITQEGRSFTVTPEYSHDWNAGGAFDLQVSMREEPVLPVGSVPQIEQQYYKHLEFQPDTIPCLDEHEVIAEKVGAVYQRSRVRDLFDLYLFAGRPFDRPLVRALVVLKLWEARDVFEPDSLFDRLESGRYDWQDLTRLVAADFRAEQTAMLETCIRGFSFLKKLTSEEAVVARDSRAHRQKETRNALAAWCQAQREG